MSAEKNRSRWKGVLLALGMGGAGALTGLAVGGGLMRLGGARESLIALSAWDLLALPLLFLFVIAVHEAGHLFMGLRQRMPFLLYVVGPFGLVRGSDGVRFRWFFSLGTLGGLAATMPDPGRPLAEQMKPVVLGGPLASLLLAIAGFTVLAASDGRLSAYGLIVGLLSSAIFLVTALPFRSGGFMSDGMQWLAYRRGGADVERRTRLTALMGMSMAGTRPRELDAETLRLAQEMATGSEVLSDMGVWLYSYVRALDSGDVESASLWLDRMVDALDDYPDGFRQSVAIEVAIFEALHHRRVAEAAQWMARAKGGIVDASRRHLATAAIAALQGQHEQALDELLQAERQLPRSMDAGVSRLGQDQITMLRRSLSDTTCTQSRAV